MGKHQQLKLLEDYERLKREEISQNEAVDNPARWLLRGIHSGDGLFSRT